MSQLLFSVTYAGSARVATDQHVRQGENRMKPRHCQSRRAPEALKARDSPLEPAHYMRLVYRGRSLFRSANA